MFTKSFKCLLVAIWASCDFAVSLLYITLVLQACKEVDEKCKSVIVENTQLPLYFSSIEKVEQYFRSIGGITVEEFTHKMKEEYNGNNK